MNLSDRSEIELFLRRNAPLHLYEIGDLDDFFWPHTRWFGAKGTHNNLVQIALLYQGSALPTLLAFSEDQHLPSMQTLLQEIAPVLPNRFYAHLSPDLAQCLTETHRLQPHGTHDKMALMEPSKLAAIRPQNTQRLTVDHLDEIKELYNTSYPGNWFDAKMLETGFYFGVYEKKQLVSIAGVHVYSSRYRVAALGNVTTRPEGRGKGFGTTVCAKLCQALLGSVDHIGLNVLSNNKPAIACYHKLGFSRVAAYEEYLFTQKS